MQKFGLKINLREINKAGKNCVSWQTVLEFVYIIAYRIFCILDSRCLHHLIVRISNEL